MTQFSDLLRLSERLSVIPSIPTCEINDGRHSLIDAKNKATALARKSFSELPEFGFSFIPTTTSSSSSSSSSEKKKNSLNLVPPLTQLDSLCNDLEELNIFRSKSKNDKKD
ncbi:hypothetical protein HMI55_006776 [Coelomomyces lativittatus]|nr:hypothetical protein HMI55_006776 [Coelomomyces lativittatus]